MVRSGSRVRPALRGYGGALAAVRQRPMETNSSSALNCYAVAVVDFVGIYGRVVRGLVLVCGEEMSDNVVHLKFSTDKAEPDTLGMLSCSHCRNKTFRMLYDLVPEGFPMLQCAACGAHIGRIGWACEV